MKIARFALCVFALLVAGAIAIMVARPYLLKYSAMSRAEIEFRKLVSERNSEVYIGYPELIDRIVADNEISEMITKVHLMSPNGGNSNFESLKLLPRLKEVELYYGHEVDRIIPTLNSIAGLKTVGFHYCGQPDIILHEIDNSSFTRVSIHSFQPSIDADRLVQTMTIRLPHCTFELTHD
jgi:hypothetical protein